MSTTRSKVVSGVAGAALLFIGVGIGAASSSPGTPAAAEPAPTVTATATRTVPVPGPTVTRPAKAAPTVTKTKTVKVPGPVTTKTVKVTVQAHDAKPAHDEPAPASTHDSSGAESVAQANARGKAEDYLGLMSFSRSGLIKQLKFEGFSTSDATYGVDALHADWNKQAALKAKEYLDLMSFSRSGLIQQLEFDGFTSAQAEYGVSKAGL